MGKVERTPLRPGYEISRVIRGGWQLAGAEWTTAAGILTP